YSRVDAAQPTERPATHHRWAISHHTVFGAKHCREYSHYCRAHFGTSGQEQLYLRQLVRWRSADPYNCHPRLRHILHGSLPEKGTTLIYSQPELNCSASFHGEEVTR